MAHDNLDTIHKAYDEKRWRDVLDEANAAILRWEEIKALQGDKWGERTYWNYVNVMTHLRGMQRDARRNLAS